MVFKTAMVINKYTTSISSRLIDRVTNKYLFVPLLVNFTEDIYHCSVSGYLDLALMAIYICALITTMRIVQIVISIEIIRLVIYWSSIIALNYYGDAVPIIPSLFVLIYTMRAITRIFAPATDRSLRTWNQNTTLNMGIADEKFKYLVLFIIVLIVSSFAPQDSLLRGAPVIMVGLIVLSMSSMFGGNSQWTVITIIVFMVATILVYPELPMRLREFIGETAKLVGDTPVTHTKEPVEEITPWSVYFNNGLGVLDMRYNIVHAQSFYALQCLGIFLTMYLAVDSICGPNASRKAAIETNKERNNKHGDHKAKGSAYTFTAVWVLMAGGEIYFACFIWGPMRVVHHLLLGFVAFLYWKYIYGSGNWTATGENTAMDWICRLTTFLPGTPPEKARYVQIVAIGIVVSILLGIGLGKWWGLLYLVILGTTYRKPNMMVAAVAVPTMQVLMLFTALMERADMADNNPTIEGRDTKTRNEEDGAIIWDGGGNSNSWFHIEHGNTQNLRVQKEKRKKREGLVRDLFHQK